ncbi:serine/threonine-protein kinase [Aureliella helgolandensis]|uniref:Serine/threonine-protein kinase PrkC n=1 Tax=Aureliella helgolandensis TaxID=2527968 RepID=A0A518G9K7_9BACT|nr:serine/threonine-protein kinase [Aureliella helgolandensis]QDV25253.1 Serine/threonine-protein kinase PrkC [Aureliella helgolandensis]
MDSLQDQLLIDRLAEQFEQEFQAGKKPRIEQFLLSQQLSLRPSLLIELLKLEVELRRSAGEKPELREYRERFPECGTTVEEFFFPARKSPNKTGTLIPPGTLAVDEVGDVSQPSVVPKKLGRYELLKLLGTGGMGAVYLAEDPLLKRLVAIKVPRFDHGSSMRLRQRFIREARSIAAIHHPNICPVYEVSDEGNLPYLVMAFVEGKPLSEYLLQKRQYDPKVAIRLVRKIAIAVGEAHSQGIVHRDLKPENIMIDKRNEPIVMDFGLALSASDSGDNSRLTRYGQILGTPAYMSPEQASGRIEEIGPPADVYSLGVLLYELLTARLPIEGTNTLQQLIKIANEAITPLAQYRADIESQLAEVCERALNKIPSDRFADANELAKELRKLADSSNTSIEREKLTSVENKRSEEVAGGKVSEELVSVNPSPLKAPSLQRAQDARFQWPIYIIAVAALVCVSVLLLVLPPMKALTLWNGGENSQHNADETARSGNSSSPEDSIGPSHTNEESQLKSSVLFSGLPSLFGVCLQPKTGRIFIGDSQANRLIAYDGNILKLSKTMEEYGRGVKFTFASEDQLCVLHVLKGSELSLTVWDTSSSDAIKLIRVERLSSSSTVGQAGICADHNQVVVANGKWLHRGNLRASAAESFLRSNSDKSWSDLHSPAFSRSNIPLLTQSPSLLLCFNSSNMGSGNSSILYLDALTLETKLKVQLNSFQAAFVDMKFSPTSGRLYVLFNSITDSAEHLHQEGLYEVLLPTAPSQHGKLNHIMSIVGGAGMDFHSDGTLYLAHTDTNGVGQLIKISPML